MSNWLELVSDNWGSILVASVAGYVLYCYVRPSSIPEQVQHRTQRVHPARPRRQQQQRTTQQPGRGSSQSPNQLLAADLKRSFPYCPDFMHGSLVEALLAAKREDKGLFVYVHDRIPRPNPQESVVADSKILREALCTEAVSQVINANFLSWCSSSAMATTRDLEPLRPIRSLPVIAILHLPGQHNRYERSSTIVTRPLLRLEGPALASVSAENLFVVLVEAADRQWKQKGAEATIKEAKALELSRMRAEKQAQDEEYQRALAQQQQRMLEQQQADQAAEQAHSQAAAQRQQEVSEAHQEKANAEEFRNSRLAMLLPQPPETASAVTICVRLPGGHKVTRRFSPTATAQQVYCWLDIRLSNDGLRLHQARDENHIGQGHYQLVSRFPRQIHDRNVPLTQVAQGAKITLFLEELEEDCVN